MTEPITGRHRPVADRPAPPTVDAPPPELGPYARLPATDPEPGHRSTARGWFVTALLVVAAVGVAVFAVATNDPPSPATAASVTATPNTASAPTTALLPATTPAQPVTATLVAQTCGRLGVEPTADAVVDAVAALEVGPNALPADDARALVRIAARLDCPWSVALVDDTIGSGDG